MADTRFETSTAVHELLATMKGLDQGFLSGPKALADDQAVLEGYRWIFSITQVALDVYVWADTNRPRFTEIVGPYKKWGGDNSDAFYFMTRIDPSRTYRVTVDPGDAVYLSLTVYGGPDDGRYSDRIVGTLNTTQMTPNPDGTYEMIVSPNDHGGNFLELAPDAVVACTRDYMNDPVNGEKARWRIECLDPAPPWREVHTDAEVARRFRAAHRWVKDQSAMVPIPLGTLNHIEDPFPVPTVTHGWAAGDASYASGAFDLAEDEALVLKGRSPECVFWNMCLWNQFLHCFNYDYDDVTTNGSKVELDADGSWTIVIAATDPGVPNWVSTQGRPHGRIWFRWFLPERTPDPISAEVVKLSELG